MTNTAEPEPLPDGYIPCPSCNGEGELPDGSPCEPCYATGRIEVRG